MKTARTTPIKHKWKRSLVTGTLSACMILSMTACTSTGGVPISTTSPALPSPTPAQEKTAPTPKVDTTLLGTGLDEDIILTESYLIEIFESTYANSQKETGVSDADRFTGECMDIQDLINEGLLPSNGVTQYSDWRLSNHPLQQDPTPTESQAPVPSQTPAPSQPPAPTQPPVQPKVNESLPQTTEAKDTQAQQSQQQQAQEQAQQQAQSTGNFTYPPNSTTEGLSADQIASGYYVRTDKGNKIYNQAGKYQGFSTGRPKEGHLVTGEEADKADEITYGGTSGEEMADTSNFGS